jgi:uncharacterized protein (TIGR02996 family)
VTEREALTRAVAAAPEDDLPRLVFADWLEEHDEPAHAAFVRAQVELAATPPWEPFAVRLRHREPDLVTGAPWWYALPRVNGYGLEWHPDYAFRRGFAWGLIVRDVAMFFAEAARLFDAAPVGQLHLPSATLDQWKHFAAQPWLPRVKSIHFYGTRTPIEPVRVLCGSPLATGLEEIVFEASSRAGMPEVVRGLMRSPLGRRLKSLELRAGPDEPDELLEAIGYADPAPRLERLALVTMGAGYERPARLYESPVLERLTTLELVNIPEAWLPSSFNRLPGLTRLRAVECRMDGSHAATLSHSSAAAELRSVDLSNNPLEVWPALQTDPVLGGLIGLRSLNLQRTMLRDETLYDWLTRSAFWPNLVELDLRDNQITAVGVNHLTAVPAPPELTAVLLGGNPLSDAAAGKLRDHFGERVIL